jgi:hypothetical protein
MAKSHNRNHPEQAQGVVCRPSFRSDLQARRVVQFELPEFLVYALERRVLEANENISQEEAATLNDYVESELANLITLRDIAEMEITAPGFRMAVQNWLNEIET